MFISLLIALIIWLLGAIFIAIYKTFQILALGIPSSASGDHIEYKSILEYLWSGDFTSNPLATILLSLLGIGVLILIVVSVVKIILISFKGDNGGQQETSKMVLERIVKAIGLTLLIPVFIIVFNLISSKLTLAIYNITLNDAPSIEYRVSQIIFGFSSNTVWEDDLIRLGFTQAHTHGCYGIGEGIALDKFRDAFFHDTFGNINLKVVSEFFGTNLSIWNFFGLFFGCEGDCFGQILNAQWLLLFVVLIILIIGCGKGLITCGKQMVDAILLEVSYPIATNFYPLDNGQRAMTHTKSLLSKLFGATLLIFAFNMYFVIFDLIGSIRVEMLVKDIGGTGYTELGSMANGLRYVIFLLFPSNSHNDASYIQAGAIGLAYTVFVVMGAVSIQTAPQLLGHLINDQTANTWAQDQSASVSTVGSAVKTAGKLGLGVGIAGYIAGKTGITAGAMAGSGALALGGSAIQGLGNSVAGAKALGGAIKSGLTGFKNAKGLGNKLKALGGGIGSVGKKYDQNKANRGKHSQRLHKFTNFLGRGGRKAGSVGASATTGFVSHGGLGTGIGSGISGIFGAGKSRLEASKRRQSAERSASEHKELIDAIKSLKQ